MFPVASHFTFGAFLAAFPFPIAFIVSAMVVLSKGKLARMARLGRTFLISFWIICWAVTCGIALSTWSFQHYIFNSVRALEISRNSVSYFEHRGYTAAQSLQYHYAVLANMAHFQTLRNHIFGQALWYGVLFLVLPLILVWIDRRQARLLGAVIPAAL